MENYTAFFKSIIEQDNAPVVICNLDDTIIYMNKSAIEHNAHRGGADLIGKSIMDCHNPQSRDKMKKVVNWFKKSPQNNIVHTFYNEKQNKDVYMVALRSGETLIGYYEKHEYRNKDTMDFYAID